MEGVGWLDREWSSNLLNQSQIGWDWFSLHLDNRQKIMLFKVRQNDGDDFISGAWIKQDGTKELLQAKKFYLKRQLTPRSKAKKFQLNGKFLFLEVIMWLSIPKRLTLSLGWILASHWKGRYPSVVIYLALVIWK